jgi:hypothetical protein
METSIGNGNNSLKFNETTFMVKRREIINYLRKTCPEVYNDILEGQQANYPQIMAIPELASLEERRKYEAENSQRTTALRKYRTYLNKAFSVIDEMILDEFRAKLRTRPDYVAANERSDPIELWKSIQETCGKTGTNNQLIIVKQEAILSETKQKAEESTPQFLNRFLRQRDICLEINEDRTGDGKAFLETNDCNTLLKNLDRKQNRLLFEHFTTNPEVKERDFQKLVTKISMFADKHEIGNDQGDKELPPQSANFVERGTENRQRDKFKSMYRKQNKFGRDNNDEEENPRYKRFGKGKFGRFGRDRNPRPKSDQGGCKFCRDELQGISPFVWKSHKEQNCRNKTKFEQVQKSEVKSREKNNKSERKDKQDQKSKKPRYALVAVEEKPSTKIDPNDLISDDFDDEDE